MIFYRNYARLPIFVVQHIPSQITKSLASSLVRRCSHAVVEASEKLLVKSRASYVVRGGLHMVLAKSPLGKMQIGIHEDDRVHGCRPSVDLFYKSPSR